MSRSFDDIPKLFNTSSYFVDRHLLEGRGENIAIECNDEKITYRHLAEKINRFGNGLKKMGVAFGDRIIIALPDTPEFFISFLGAIKIGAIPIPVNTLLNTEEYQYFLNDSTAKVVVTTQSLFHTIGKVPLAIIVDDERSFYPSEDLSLEAYPTDKDDVALWLYSSGSTGRPKACMHRHRDMVIAADRYANKVLEMTERDKNFSVGKLFFAYGLGNSLFCPLSVGATAVLMPDPPKPENIFRVIKKYQPTLFFSMPSNYLKLLDYAENNNDIFDVSSIRIFTSAGEVLPMKIAKRFRQKFGGEILDSIGATELFIFTANRPGANRPGSAGQMIPGYEAKLLDENNQPVATGAMGNLFIRSDTVCLGYWNQSEKTEAAIHEDWFRTNDICRQDADGYFWYIGRADDMFKSNGAWVSPLEVEEILLDHPSIHEAAVIGAKDENDLTKPVAYIVVKEAVADPTTLIDGIHTFVKARMPAYKRPREIFLVSELPRTTTGKLQRFKLRRGYSGIIK
jgi:benzoate-CoA ligase family protein